MVVRAILGQEDIHVEECPRVECWSSSLVTKAPMCRAAVRFQSLHRIKRVSTQGRHGSNKGRWITNRGIEGKVKNMQRNGSQGFYCLEEKDKTSMSALVLDWNWSHLCECINFNKYSKLN